ncbi:MAG: nitrogen regulation protein NR(II) [Candidatus Aminicenantia bacterium]
MDKDLKKKIARLISLRIIVITTLLGSVIITQFITSVFLSLKIIYGLVLVVYLLSAFYTFLYHFNHNYIFQAYLQLIGDLLVTTGLVYFSGGLISPFTFLYILPIITASIILYNKRGSYIIASLSSILFGSLVDLMYFKIVPFYRAKQGFDVSFGLVSYNIFVAIAAFFAVAYLSNILAENLRKTGQKLKKAEKELLLKEKLVAIGEMAVGLAHELRNPMAAISGSIQVLRSELKLNGEQKSLMDIVVKESKRLSRTVEQFLDYAIPHSHEKEGINLTEILKETITLIDKESNLKGKYQITGNFNHSPFFYWGNSAQFKQVFWNLIKNSIQAMPDGGNLEVNFFKKDSKYLEIRVRDNGRGMSQEEKERIFEPFFSRFKKGKGLGMAIVYRIVEEYKGKIDVISEEGKGTEIKITLPPTEIVNRKS